MLPFDGQRRAHLPHFTRFSAILGHSGVIWALQEASPRAEIAHFRVKMACFRGKNGPFWTPRMARLTLFSWQMALGTSPETDLAGWMDLAIWMDLSSGLIS